MKTFLRLLVTAAIVIAIVFGVKTLVGDKRTESYVYDNLVWKAEYSATGLDENLNKFYEYMGENASDFASGGDYEQVAVSLSSGEYYSVSGLYQQAETMFSALRSKSALAKRVTKGLQTNVVKSYKEFQNAVESEKAACEKMDKITKADSHPHKADMIGVFNEITNSYKKALEALLNVNEQLRIYILNDVYDGELMSFVDIKDGLIVQMMYAYSNNNNLENDMNNMMNRLNEITEVEKTELVVSYSNSKDISKLLNAENKADYIKNANDSLKSIARILFGIGA